MLITVLKFLSWALPVGVIALYFWPAKSYTFYEIPDEFRELAENYDVPPMPDGWEWKTFTAADGTKIRWGIGEEIASSKATLLIIPGFTGTLELYAEQMSYWQEQGYRIAGIDPRGQGGSERAFPNHPDKPYVKDFKTYIDDLDSFVRANRADLGGPLIIVGTSMGSHIGFRAIGEMQTPADGLVMLAPALRPRTHPVSFETAKKIGIAAKIFNKSNHYTLGQGDWKPWSLDMKRPSECSNDQGRLNRYDAVLATKPELRAGGATNGWLSAFMRSNEMITSPEFYKPITTPIEMVHASDDIIVVPEIAMAVCDDMASCEQRTIPNSGHCLQLETDAVLKQVYKAVDDLVARVNGQ